jgi:replicative DNA helicase
MNAPDWIREAPPDDEVSRLRVPPHSVEAEQSVLGGLLIDANAWDRVADMLAPADFYRHENRTIFEAIGGLYNAGKTVDVITAHVALQEVGKAQDVGGLQYLNALAQSVPSAANMRRYAEIVRERALLRAIIAGSDEIATSAFNPQGKSVGDVLDRAQALFGDLGRTRRTRDPVHIGSLLQARVDRYGDLAAGNVVPGMSTGHARLDDLLCGLRAGLYVVAARPSVGKSSFAADIAQHVAEATGKPALFLSQEMQAGRVTDRAVARIGGIRLRSLITGRLSNDEWAALPPAVERLHAMPFHIDDEPAQKLASIRRKARGVKGLGLLVVDYLQLCGTDLKTDNRNLQIEQLTRGLKELSTELDIPILALSQLNRAVEGRANKRPNLGDLRDSGAIEQDADSVIFLWPARENADDKAAGVKQVGVGIDKNRDGELGDLYMQFRGAYQQWEESDYIPPSPVAGRRAEGGFE